MAKCVVDRNGRVHRVSAQEADEIVEQGGRYITKNEWQRALAGVPPPRPARQPERMRVG